MMTVEISGTASQVQTAQQLIQNFMAEAGPSQPQAGESGTDQAFNSYAAAPPPSNPSHAGGYGSVYGPNYGF
ncbi:hypothetical protein K1719_033292 [Acacia pycnantha]|nr:hypothetical protein K1719_033292 [Acacia pycnantha]